MGIKIVLSKLAQLDPLGLLEISATDSSSHASNPVEWSMRWCVLAGSLRDLLLGDSTTHAVFWPVLVSAVNSQQGTGQLDIWGVERQLDANSLQALHQDTSNAVWGQWLSCALLSGMLSAELLQCPALATEVLMRSWAAPMPQPPSSLTLTAAVTLVDGQAAFTLQACLRVAVASVIAVTAATAAIRTVRLTT